MTWILIIWVTGHQLPVYGYTHQDCIDAAQIVSAPLKGKNVTVPIAYCIPAPADR